jgi:hypothetical protein
MGLRQVRGSVRTVARDGASPPCPRCSPLPPLNPLPLFSEEDNLAFRLGGTTGFFDANRECNG